MWCPLIQSLASIMIDLMLLGKKQTHIFTGHCSCGENLKIKNKREAAGKGLDINWASNYKSMSIFFFNPYIIHIQRSYHISSCRRSHQHKRPHIHTHTVIQEWWWWTNLPHCLLKHPILLYLTSEILHIGHWKQLSLS